VPLFFTKKKSWFLFFLQKNHACHFVEQEYFFIQIKEEKDCREGRGDEACDLKAMGTWDHVAHKNI